MGIFILISVRFSSSADSNSDFIVPFSDVLFLDKSETTDLQTQNTISLDTEKNIKPTTKRENSRLW